MMNIAMAIITERQKCLTIVKNVKTDREVM